MSDELTPLNTAITLRIDDPMIVPLVPLAQRDAVKLLWRLDNRLAEMAGAGKEPALRQIRLRWWADQLRLTESGTVSPEPLLADVVESGLAAQLGSAKLSALAEAWMDAADGEADPQHGALLFELTAQMLGTDVTPELGSAGRLWAGVAHCLRHDGSTASEAPSGWDALNAAAVSVRHLPRPLAALTGLVRAIALRRGERRRGREQLLILRIGLFGR